MSYSVLSTITPTPHQKRRSDNAHCQPRVVKEATHTCTDDYDERAICPMCKLPMHVCDGHPELSEAELFEDYCERNRQTAPYEMQRRMFDEAQMAALSPEAARYQRRKVARE